MMCCTFLEKLPESDWNWIVGNDKLKPTIMKTKKISTITAINENVCFYAWKIYNRQIIVNISFDFLRFFIIFLRWKWWQFSLTWPSTIKRIRGLNQQLFHKFYISLTNLLLLFLVILLFYVFQLMENWKWKNCSVFANIFH